MTVRSLAIELMLRSSTQGEASAEDSAEPRDRTHSPIYVTGRGVFAGPHLNMVDDSEQRTLLWMTLKRFFNLQEVFNNMTSLNRKAILLHHF